MRWFRKSSKIFKVFLVIVLFSQASLYVAAQTEFDDDIEQKQGELDESREKQYAYQQEGLSIAEKLTAMEDDAKKIEEEIAAREAELEELSAELDAKNEEIEEKEAQVSEMSVSLYKLSHVSVVEVLLASEGMGGLVQNVAMHTFGIGKLTSQVEGKQTELADISSEYNEISEGVSSQEGELAKLREDKVALENQKRAYEQMAAAEAAYQSQLIQEIAALSAAAQQAIGQKAGGHENPGSGGGDNGGGTSPQPPQGDPGQYDVYRGGTKVASNVSGPIRVVPTSASVFSVDGGAGRFRGILEMRSDTNVYIINELDFEYYLRGIGEMPSSWPANALRTQAVAARTYAVANWNKRSNYGYNLRDDTYDQNYTGYNKEAGSYGSNWVSAVTSTSGKIVTSGGSPISAYYHSTCGGHTLSSQEVWGGSRSYAQAESDRYQSGGQWVSYDAASPWSYKKWGSGAVPLNGLSGMYDLANAAIWLNLHGASPASQDNVIRPDLGPGWNEATLRSNLGGNSVQNQIGTIQSVTQIYNSGGSSIDANSRVTNSLRITGSGGTIDIPGGMFKLAYNLRSPADNVLFSTLWTVKLEGGSYNFYSRGYPHRVGMCQYGAYGRALAGQNYSQILTHYYRGTSVTGFSPPSSFRVGITKVGGPTTVFSANGGFSVYANGSNVASGGSGESWSVVKK